MQIKDNVFTRKHIFGQEFFYSPLKLRKSILKEKSEQEIKMQTHTK